MVAALPVVAIALVLLLILFLLASPTFRRAVTDTISGIPLIGGWLATNTDALLLRLFSQLNTWAAVAAQPIEGLFSGLANLVTLFPRGVSAAVEATAAASWQLRYLYLPLAVRQAEQFAAARSLEAVNYATALSGFVARYAQALFSAGLAWTAAAINQESLRASNLVLRAMVYSQVLFGVQTEYANRLYLSAVTEAQRGEQRAEAYTQASSAALAAWAEELFATAVQRADQETAVAEGFAAQLAGDNARYTDLRHVQAMAYTASVTGAIVAAVEAIERSPCMQQCEPLGQLGSELAALDLFALIAWLVAAGQDPKAAAREIEAELRPLADLVAGTLAELGGPKVAA